jgi:hypothetical protein
MRGTPHRESVCMDLACEECWFGLPKCTECNGAGAEWTVGDSNDFKCMSCALSPKNPESSHTNGCICD